MGGGPRPCLRKKKGDAHPEKGHSDRLEGSRVLSWALEEIEVRQASTGAQDNELCQARGACIGQPILL